MHTSYIGIGSNLGDRSNNIARAIELLDQHDDIDVIATSTTYEFAALMKDGQKQPDYLNAATKLTTTLKPLDLLDALQAIERKLGRPIEHGFWQPRTIDLDILIYDARVVQHPRLTIPHPEIAKRVFVLRPLCDIASALAHPLTGETMRTLLEEHESR